MRRKIIRHFLFYESEKNYFIGKIIFPVVSLILFFISSLVIRYFIIIKVSIYPLIAGFFFAAIRSWCKEKRILKRGKEKKEDVIKPAFDMLWTYLINYPVILSLIYILGNYFLWDYPWYPSWAILFGLGFFIDTVFKANISLIKH